ncbi:hypothetical protein CNECB9_4690003 [Cupriavidus necator]|uniref:Uncharacterized protein n=1 Tax=Cupriavidus necator TaxID=106590 RepID=A0A1K0JKL3_CUPNE|nr:hypothetical protein CNECB9_4690003 [Cupriavidus necator]
MHCVRAVHVQNYRSAAETETGQLPDKLFKNIEFTGEGGGDRWHDANVMTPSPECPARLG